FQKDSHFSASIVAGRSRGDVAAPRKSRYARRSLMEVGFTRRRVAQGLRVNLVIGLVAVALGLFALFLDRDPSDNPSVVETLLTFVVLFCIPSTLWLVLCAVLSSVTLRISTGVIERILWRRFVMDRRPITELTGVSGGGFSTLLLHFRGGRRMALPGI